MTLSVNILFKLFKWEIVSMRPLDHGESYMKSTIGILYLFRLAALMKTSYWTDQSLLYLSQSQLQLKSTT